LDEVDAAEETEYLMLFARSLDPDVAKRGEIARWRGNFFQFFGRDDLRNSSLFSCHGESGFEGVI
jgi:hypothetical protein